MLRANLKIISSLKEFLFEVGNKIELKNYFSFSKEDFTRNRKLTFENLALFILRLNKKTLCIEIDNFFKELGSKITCTVSAFTQQRLKLHPGFFIMWNQQFCESFYKFYGSNVKRWKGYRIVSCDGSSISLVNRPALKNCFGGQSNANDSYVLAKTFYCYDSLNEIVLHADIKPYRYGEFRMACDLIDSGQLQSDMLLVFDRHYSAYSIAALIEFNEQRVKFLIRTNDNYNYTKEFLKSKKESAIIDLFPTANSIKGLKKYGYLVKSNHSLKVRLIKLKLSKKKVHVYMTNLLDEEKFPANELKKIYALRWKVETQIDFQKNILQLESMSGLTPLTVMQDFYASVFLSNMYSIIIKPSQNKIDKTTNGKYPKKINNNIAAAKIKQVIICIFVNENPRQILSDLSDIFIRWTLPIRKNRSFPRERINSHGRSKHRTFSNYKPAG